MECPFCAKIESDVIDSRLNPEKNAIRRRRRCSACAGRFTTYESTPEHFLFLLMKQHTAKGASMKRPKTLFAFMSSAFKGLSEGVEKLAGRVDEIEKARAEIKANKKLVAKPAAKARPKKRRAPAKKKVAVPKAKQLKKVKVEKLVEKMDKVEKASAVSKDKKKAAAKARPKKKRAPVRKKIVVREAKKVKKARRMTAIDEVLNIIKRHRRGVDITKLKNKTGFADSKLRMIVSRACRQGKIKRVARGVYVAA